MFQSFCMLNPPTAQSHSCSSRGLQNLSCRASLDDVLQTCIKSALNYLNRCACRANVVWYDKGSHVGFQDVVLIGDRTLPSILQTAALNPFLVKVYTETLRMQDAWSKVS